MTVVQGRWRRAVAVVLLVTMVGCTSGASEPDEVSGSEPVRDPADVSDGGSVDVGARLRLEAALGHHAMLVIDASRSIADGSPREAGMRRDLERNTDELTDIAGEALGAAAAQFRDAWQRRVEALLTVVEGEGAGDDLAAAQADYGAAVAAALDDRLSAADAATQLAELDGELVAQAEAYRDGDVDEAFATQRQSYGTAVRVGQQLVLAAGADDEAASGAAELRSALQQLFGEHAWLTVLTTRHAARGSENTAVAGAALNGNSQDITAALLSIYGEQPAVRFDSAWRDALGAAVDFSVAVGELDDGDRRRARRRSDGAVADAAQAVAVMTADSLARSDAQEHLADHFALARRHGAAAANGRWRRASQRAEQLYRSGIELGDLLATAIAEHRADEFPAR